MQYKSLSNLHIIKNFLWEISGTNCVVTLARGYHILITHIFPSSADYNFVLAQLQFNLRKCILIQSTNLFSHFINNHKQRVFMQSILIF